MTLLCLLVGLLVMGAGVGCLWLVGLAVRRWTWPKVFDGMPADHVILLLGAIFCTATGVILVAYLIGCWLLMQHLGW